MQTALDNNLKIIIRVDLGLGRVSRKNFAKNYDMTVRSLFPIPNTIFVEGSELNRTGWMGTFLYGISPQDAACMRDVRLKRALEIMGAVVHDIENDWSLRKALLRLSQMAAAPSEYYLIVLQAIFV